MSAPSLTISEQRTALSWRKNKKIKNVLGMPESYKVKNLFVEINKAEKLYEILNRLLPPARLPFQENLKFGEEITKQNFKDLQLRETAKSKRDQLSLGVNALNKCIKKNLISAVLLDNDIQPKFLINHLSLLCDYNKIPFLHIPGLREITKTNLGFPCIAIGFRVDSCDFFEAIEEIKSIFKTIVSNIENQETETDSSESSEAEVASNQVCTQSDKIQFTYLYRTSVKERVFVPEQHNNASSVKKTKVDFISLEENLNGTICEKFSHSGVSSNIMRKKQIRDERLQNFCIQPCEDKDLEPFKKKARKAWVIDKVGKKQNCKYNPAKLFKIPSNPDRYIKKK